MEFLRRLVKMGGFLLMLHGVIVSETIDNLLSVTNKSVVAPGLEHPGEPILTHPEEPILAHPVETPIAAVAVKPVEPVAIAINTNKPELLPHPVEVLAPQVSEPVMSHVLPKVGPSMAVKPSEEEGPSVSIAATIQPQESLEISDIHDVSSVGLDTLNIDSAGNWLEKRIWYKKAEQLFEIVRNSLQKTGDLRMKFINEVSAAGQRMDDFYEQVSFQRGHVDELLTAVLEGLDQAAQLRGGDLSSDQRALKVKVHAEQKTIEAVSKDMKTVEDLDAQIDKTMTKAFHEIDICRGLETRSWNNFKDIGNELDDKKARVLYYEMENFHKNIEQKMTYLQTNLLPYLQLQLVAKVESTILQIKNNVETLDQKGLNLQKLMQKDDKGDLLIFRQREKEQEILAEGSAEAKELTASQKEEQQKHKQLKTSDTWYSHALSLVQEYGQLAVVKISEWIIILLCCLKCLVCYLQQFICRLLGY